MELVQIQARVCERGSHLCHSRIQCLLCLLCSCSSFLCCFLNMGGMLEKGLDRSCATDFSRLHRCVDGTSCSKCVFKRKSYKAAGTGTPCCELAGPRYVFVTCPTHHYLQRSDASSQHRSTHQWCKSKWKSFLLVHLYHEDYIGSTVRSRFRKSIFCQNF